MSRLLQERKKAYVGLSGGVDSSVSAALLKEQGFDVTGVFIKVWQPDFIQCTWREDRRDAMRVCAALDIPFETLDLEEVYKREVVDYMTREYAAGRTPNPDVMCNRHVKFGAFLEYARTRGAAYVATGHYAQNIHNADTGQFELWAGSDPEKDQSYFLWTLTQEDLRSILFPVGHLHKQQVRQLAARYALPTATKRDSQGLCFLGKIDMPEFVSHFVPLKQGAVLDVRGRRIGRHKGALLYTLGQRHGFSVDMPEAAPLYVVGKSLDDNTVTVAPDPRTDIATRSSLLLTAENWMGGKPDADRTYGARTRYRQELHSCTFVREAEATRAVFSDPAPLAPSGQSLVAYEQTPRGNLCIGGGIIA